MRDWLTKDFHWKAFSLLMAVGIWLTVRKFGEPAEVASPGNTSITYPVAVQAMAADRDVRGAQIIPDKVNATITGPPSVMSQLSAGQIFALVNLTGVNSARDLPYDVEIALPAGAAVLHVDPPQVDVTLAKPK